MKYVWTCRCCGKQYDTLPLSYALPAPDPWLAIPETEHGDRGQISSDTCAIDGSKFYVRGCLEIPIADCPDRFVWGVWVSVSEKSFDRIGELWDVELRDKEPPFFGWLCNDISIYPRTLKLKTHLHLRNGGMRPFIELEPTDHPLAVEQRNGMTLQRVKEIASLVLQHQ